MLGVRGMTMGAALTFGAVLWWATRGTEPAPEGSARLRESSASHADAFTTNVRSAAADRDDPAAASLPEEPGEEFQASPDEIFSDYVEDKYRFLLANLSRSAPRDEELRAALHQREQLQVAINTARQGNDAALRAGIPAQAERLAEMDRRITGMLPAGELAAFDALKDSHIEQFQIDDYAAGIGNVAPLRDEQRRAILFSKLAYRHRFREVLEESGLLRGDLPPAERSAALRLVSRALLESRDGFLQEARQHLGDEQQYGQLANYEQGEYAAELEKLRSMVAGG